MTAQLDMVLSKRAGISCTFNSICWALVLDNAIYLHISKQQTRKPERLTLDAESPEVPLYEKTFWSEVGTW